MEFLKDRKLQYLLYLLLFVLSIFLFSKTATTLKEYKYIGTSSNTPNTLQVSASAKVVAKPDTAKFTVTIKESDKDKNKAQDKATKTYNELVSFLKSQGIDEKDIKTETYYVSPRYDWLPDQGRVFRDYEVVYRLSIKIKKDIEKASEILAKVSSMGVSNVGSLQFEISDKELLKKQARDKAIQQAKLKAKDLARQLDIELVRVVGYSESFGGDKRPYPVLYRAEAMAKTASPEVPELQVGQDEISATVTLTYEIR